MNKDEYNALGETFSSLKWELPGVQEYKNDLVQPDLASVAGVPKSDSSALAIAEPPIDPKSPATEKQWAKCNKMVAWFCAKLNFLFQNIFFCIWHLSLETSISNATKLSFIFLSFSILPIYHCQFSKVYCSLGAVFRKILPLAL